MSVLTVILRFRGLLLSRAGESDQHSRLLGCCLLTSRESTVDSCEVDMLDEHVSISLLLVWRWPMESGKDRDL